MINKEDDVIYDEYCNDKHEEIEKLEDRLKSFIDDNTHIVEAYEKYREKQRNLEFQIRKAKEDITGHRNLIGKYISLQPFEGSKVVYYIHVKDIEFLYFDKDISFKGPAIILSYKSGKSCYIEEGLNWIDSKFNYDDVFNRIFVFPEIHTDVLRRQVTDAQTFETLKNNAIACGATYKEIMDNIFE